MERHHTRGRQAIAGFVVGLARRHQGGRGRGGLVAGRLLPGERLEDPATLLWRRLGGQRPNRPAIELHRLAVRGDPRGGSSAGECRPMRLRGASRELEVLRRVHRGPDARLATELGDEAVQPAALAERDRRVDRVPDQLIAEVVFAGPVVRLEERVCRELREWRCEGLVRHRQELAGDRGQEPPADHRARRRQRPGFGDRARSRSSTVASIVSGTPDARTSSAVIGASSPSMPTSSSTNSGIPSVRSWIAAMASSVTAWPSSRIRAITAVSSAERRARRASSASRCVSRRVRHSPMPEPAASSSVRRVATTRSGRSGSRRARDASTSRLRSSAQWRSSNASSVGSVAASVRMSTRSRTSMRRRCDRAGRPSSSGCARRSTSRSPAAARPGDRRIDRARSPRIASGTSWSCGARPPLAVLKPAADACRMTEPSSRVLPIPALPLRSSR